jgi:hypothetical protein
MNPGAARSEVFTERMKGRMLRLAVLAFSVAGVMPLEAGFVGNYQLGNFLLTNVEADGFAVTPDGGVSVVLTGGNTGSGQPGSTDLTIPANAAGIVAFTFLYSSLDLPGFDYAGYILGSTFLQFADSDGQSATVTFPVIAGQIFGFRIGTVDNTGEPGMLTISNFEAPGGVSEIPEPGTLAMVLAAAALFGRIRAARVCVGDERK